MTMEEIIDLEKMSKICLCESERESMCRHMEFLSQSFKEIGKINTDGIEPLIQVTDLKNVFREDSAVKTVTREEVLLNAPEQNNNYFQVPKTIE